MNTLIHPTAVIDSRAKLAPDVRVGPLAVIEGPVTIGPGCIINAHAHLIGPLTMGSGNIVHGTAVLGGWPQDRKFHDEPSETIIGDDNVFREGVTVHRGTGANTKTILGARCYLMVNSHVGHNCIVGDDVTLTNGSLLGGHVHVGDRAIVGANSAIHQFCRLGRLSMISNNAGYNVDVPPFFTGMTTNHITQLNVVGLRRSGMSPESINALRKVFQLLRAKRQVRAILNDLPAELTAISEVREWVEFCRASKRGVAVFQPWSERGAVPVGTDQDPSNS